MTDQVIEVEVDGEHGVSKITTMLSAVTLRYSADPEYGISCTIWCHGTAMGSISPARYDMLRTALLVAQRNEDMNEPGNHQ